MLSDSCKEKFDALIAVAQKLNIDDASLTKLALVLR